MATAGHEEKSSLLPAILVAAGVIGVTGFIVVTNLNASSEASKVANQAIDAERPAKDLRLQQQGELLGPAAWVDKNKGTVRLPIDRAMAVVVRQIQNDPTSATPAPPPPPEPAQEADGGADATSAEGGAAVGDGGAAVGDAAPPAPDAGSADASGPHKRPIGPAPSAPTAP